MLSEIRQIFQRKKQRPFQLFQIESSLDCSLACVMCPWTEIRSPGAMMSWETFMRIAQYLEQTASVDFTGGGEPLKNPNLVAMTRAAKEAGCEVGFSTNGVRLTREIAEQMVKNQLDWISFSVDAASAHLYESIRQGARYEVVIGNMAILRDVKREMGSQLPRMMMVYVMMTGEQENYHELPQFIDLAHQLGVEQVIAKNLDVILKDGDDSRRTFSHDDAVINPAQNAIEEAKKHALALGLGLRLYNSIPQEQTICEHYPLTNLFFNWEGYVSPCITLSYAEERIFNGERVHTPCQRFGNIRDEDLMAIWEKPAYRAFRQRFEARQNAERQATLDHLLGGASESSERMPPAPEGCQTCYYLYGI
jgi:MoaA/NifB/PqqE/SkfB family radical SAM enzyme